MANTYDTSLFPLGSTEVKVLFNNASNLDDAVNDLVNTTWTDRFGEPRKTWFGIEKDASDALLATGYEFIGDYDSPGELTFTRPNQVMSKSGEYWRPGPSLTLPYTTVNNWVTDQPKFVSIGDSALRSALADAVSLANGATLVARASPQFKSIATLKTWQGRYDGDAAVLIGADPSKPGKGDRWVRWDAASTLTPNDANIIQVTGISVGRWILFGRVTINAADWGMYGDGTDITTNFASMMAYIAGLGDNGIHATVKWPAGNHVKSVCPNLAYRGLVFEFEGEVIWTHTGTGPNLLVDFGALSGMKGDGVYIGTPGKPVTLRGGSGTGRAIYNRAFVGNGCIAANIHGCGTTSQAMRAEWSVLVDYYINITPGDLSTGTFAWYGGGVPAVGVSLGERLTGEQCSYNQFWNLKATGCGVGVYLESTLGNNFWGGDSEYSSSIGLLTTTNALKDKFWGTNFEVNPTDVSCIANGLRLIGCDMVKAVFGATSLNCKMLGCLTDAITIVAGAVGNQIADTSFSRGISSTDIVDAGTDTRHRDNYNMTTNKYQNAPRVVLAPTVSFPGGVFTWTNTTGDTVFVQGTGGTITNVSVGNGGDIATIPYPMNRIGILNGEAIAFSGSGALVVKVWRGV